MEASWKLQLNSIGFEFIVDEAVKRAFDIGRSGNPIERLITIFKVRNQGVNFECHLTYDKEKLKNYLSMKKNGFDKKMKNATVTFTMDGIIVHKDTIGRILDIDGSLVVLENRIGKRMFGKIILEPKLLMPEISYNEVKDIKNIKNEFLTYFNPNDKGMQAISNALYEKVQPLLYEKSSK
jgi:vancomycin resistance protein YoaR